MLHLELLVHSQCPLEHSVSDSGRASDSFVRPDHEPAFYGSAAHHHLGLARRTLLLLV